jgi:FAD dependent monooxygenase
VRSSSPQCADSWGFCWLTKARFDQKAILLDRQQAVSYLYDGLPDKSRIKTSKRVVDIQQDADGVRVILSDGTVEEGDIVIGADGVHSLVREFVWKHADQVTPGKITLEEKQALFTEYRGLFGVSPRPAELGEAELNLLNGYGRFLNSFTQPDRVFWAVVWKDEIVRYPNIVRYTPEDMEREAQKNMDLQIVGDVTFKRLWETRTRAGVVPIEEGCLEHWHSGRFVMVGDAIHKV